jgi:hypothetical protein
MPAYDDVDAIRAREGVFVVGPLLPHRSGRISIGTVDPEDQPADACERCNLFKGSDLAGIDPQTGQVERLYNPRADTWAQHFELRGPLIVGRRATSRATVEVLSMNAGQRLQLRAALIAHGLYP